MTSEGPDIAKEIPVSIEAIGDKVLASQFHVSRIITPFIGWLLLTFVLFDVMGNIIGFPVITGSIFGGVKRISGTDDPYTSRHGFEVTKRDSEKSPQFRWVAVVHTRAAGAVSFGIQLVILVASVGFLYFSPWRFWLPVMFSTDEFESGVFEKIPLVGGKFRSLYSIISESGLRIAQAGIKEDEDPHSFTIGFRVFLSVIVIVCSMILMAVLWHASVMLLVIGVFVIVFGDSAMKCVHLFWQRISSDFGSLLGMYLGVALAAAFSLLMGAQWGLYYQFPFQVWFLGDFFVFRLLEVFLLSAVILMLSVQSQAGLKCAVFYRAQKPEAGFRRSYHVFDYRKVASWPVFVYLDPDSITKAVVLLRRDDKHYEVIDHSLRIPLMSGIFTVLNLSALESRLGDTRVRVKDGREFFTCEAEYRISPRSFDSLKSTMLGELGNSLPDRAVGLVLDEIFKNEKPLNLFNDTFAKAFVEYSNGKNKTARDIREKYTSIEAEIRVASMFVDAQLQIPSTMVGGDVGGLALSITGYSQLRAAGSRMRDLIEGPREEWKYYREKKAQARTELPGVFLNHLRSHFMKELIQGETTPGDEVLEKTADCLLACFGVHLVVNDFDFAPGPSRECENMIQTLEAGFAAKQERIDQEIQRREQSMLDFFQRRIERVEENKREVVNQLIQTAPHVLPYLLQTRGGERLVDYLLSLGESALRNSVESLSRIPADRPAEIEAQVNELAGVGGGGDLGGSGA
ncbi:MAG: hypothetical protein HONDAALG_01545 [Gammaproteobacteria bacterium]|nr:hypothetical protein [Gammaproteobacteria bacterium]